MSESANEQAKRRKRGRVRDASTQGIAATAQKPRPNFFDDNSEKCVGVYARVSTDDAQQTLSYEMQQKYYSELVDRHENWKLVRIYTDEGKTGTTIRHREGFHSMIEDCRDGKIDLIITKNVSRFSRNIVDAIAYVRALAAQTPPVGVYFENEGIYTLSPDSEMRLSFTAAIAQEESRTRSVAMNSSIDMRFSHGMFLTPPLLGYDNDEDGQLVINEEEAVTVRLIFFMYLSGHSTGDIAEKLTELGKKTKKGSTRWSAGSVYSQLVNERHYGAVCGRKTWTPNFLDHLAKKNRTYEDGSSDRKQYTKTDHHEAIISCDDFFAAQRMITNAKYGNHSYLPQLHVITGGALHGFVSINPRWAAFSAEDYLLSSASAGNSNTTLPIKPYEAKQGDIDLRDGEVIQAQSFVDAAVSCATFNEDTLRFSSACVRCFNGREYVELLIHPVRKLLAVRPCEKTDRNSIRWANISGGNAYGRDIGCTAYINTLYSLLDWEPNTKYRIRCTLHKRDCGTYAIFDAKDSRTTARRNYYELVHRQTVPKARKAETSAMYNPLPDLHPTSEATLYEAIAQITGKMRSDTHGD